MLYCLRGHGHEHEVQTVCQAFYPNERFTAAAPADIMARGCPMAVLSELNGDDSRAALFERGRLLCEASERAAPGASGRKKAVKRAVYRAFLAYTGFKPPWGSFTGIRPSKILHELWGAGLSDEQAARSMRETFDMDEDKIALCFEVARAERALLAAAGRRDFSLYVGIPFCPTRCMYCSFTAYPLRKYEGAVERYLDCVIREMAQIAPFGEGRRLESVYIGGGTPTALSAGQLERLIRAIHNTFDTAALSEFTVEAGRPDTITDEKLAVMNGLGVTRVSINPQTMNGDTLLRIGRAHTVEQFYDAFEAARRAGVGCVNVDLIVGLPGEGACDIHRTMELIAPLSPENITLHTLAVKRGSKLHEELVEGGSMATPHAAAAADMMNAARAGARAIGLRPYCMYRQKNMVGHCENIGYCKPGYESAYNVRILVERQTILAVGAGAVTKLFSPETNRLERIFNVKNVDDYMDRLEEMLERKAMLRSCFDDSSC